MHINNLLNTDTFLDDFYAFSAGNRPVEIKWNNTSIHTITGPTPFVDISRTFEDSSSTVPSIVIDNITLSGKIIKESGAGISYVMSGISGLQNLFSGCPTSKLDIICDSNTLFSISGARVKDISFSKTEDNWVRSADYTISLERRTAINSQEQVEDKSESWSIEPLDDIIYTNFTRSVDAKTENTPSPFRSAGSSNAVGGGRFGGNSLQIFNLPQYRISRRLSAKGIPIATGSNCSTSSTEVLKVALQSAKKWVQQQSSGTFSASGSIYLVNPYANTWLYNHVRTVNADVYNSTYEINDSWLAMPSGIPYTETFTIDASTDAENNKTVRVAGNIQGLSLMPSGNMNHSPLSGTNSNEINLSYSMNAGTSQSLSYPNAGAGNSQITTMDDFKYNNALQAWMKDIKPYLYRRACSAINSEDRTYEPINNLEPSNPPPNPIYTRESLLNVTPTSTSEGHDPIKGTISYSHEFNNKLQLIAGTLSENIRISNTAPTDSIQEIQVIGRALGPILFSAGRTNARKTISVDIVVSKPTGIKGTLMSETVCPMYTGGFLWTTVNQLISGNAPFANRTTSFFDNATSQTDGSVFKESDSEDWSPTDGRYSRSVSWIYQQCSTNKFYLDH